MEHRISNIFFIFSIIAFQNLIAQPMKMHLAAHSCANGRFKIQLLLALQAILTPTIPMVTFLAYYRANRETFLRPDIPLHIQRIKTEGTL